MASTDAYVTATPWALEEGIFPRPQPKGVPAGATVVRYRLGASSAPPRGLTVPAELGLAELLHQITQGDHRCRDRQFELADGEGDRLPPDYSCGDAAGGDGVLRVILLPALVSAVPGPSSRAPPRAPPVARLVDAPAPAAPGGWLADGHCPPPAAAPAGAFTLLYRLGGGARCSPRPLRAGPEATPEDVLAEIGARVG
jgi:hypothetical protein